MTSGIRQTSAFAFELPRIAVCALVMYTVHKELLLRLSTKQIDVLLVGLNRLIAAHLEHLTEKESANGL